MSLLSLKKQEALNQKKMKALLLIKENKRCFDCSTNSPFFVNITLNTFICARCSGLIREIGHRVKSIHASTFTSLELVALEQGGNGIAAKIWLSNFRAYDVPEQDGDVKAFMKQKYIDCNWFNPVLHQNQEIKFKQAILKGQPLDTSVKLTTPKKNISPQTSVRVFKPQSNSTNLSDRNMITPEKLQNNSVHSNTFQDIISQLSGLKLEKGQNVHYTGGILSPTKFSDNKENRHENDRYAALRTIQVPEINQDDDWQGNQIQCP
ncbi:unnamed protein product [Rhizopus stolonifer]